MKRYLTFIVLMVCTFATAQNSDDILRYSNENLQGTARFQAMQGAFGALGGDLSALNINPAGLAVFKNSEFSGTFGINYNEIRTDFYGTVINNKTNIFDMPQFGGVFVMNGGRNSSNPKVFRWKRQIWFAGVALISIFCRSLFVPG